MSESPQQSYSLPAIVDRFEGTAAVLRIEGGQELRWPVKLLPDHIHEGAAVRINLSTAASEEQERERIARTILNEVLKPEPA